MRHSSLLCVLVLALAGCSGGSGGLGDACSSGGDCGASLQCLAGSCVPQCQRAPDCGEGYACDSHGNCQQATGELGDVCTSQVDCAAGLACELDPNGVTDGAGHLVATCESQHETCDLEQRVPVCSRPSGSECATDDECRDTTCALGHCVDLCSTTLDCALGSSCVQIPRVEAMGTMFSGCLQAHGALRWSIPINGPTDTVLLPVPDSAQSVAVTFAVEDASQEVGASMVTSPSGLVVVDPAKDYYANLVRHRLDFAESVLGMPSSPDTPLEVGAYSMVVTSQRSDGLPGSSTPTATAVVKLDSSALLDLHFYFLNFEDHPCGSAFGGTLNATVALGASFFQDDFLGTLRTEFAHGGVSLGTLTYEDLLDHPELDGLDVTNSAALLALGAHDIGINVFFVRTLSPVGLQAFGPNPGPAALPGTGQFGVVVGLDTLCYRSWSQLARLAAHELARYMGLYDNVEADVDLDPTHVDPIGDSDDSSANLMFYSELGGGDLSDGQRAILSRSAVLR